MKFYKSVFLVLILFTHTSFIYAQVYNYNALNFHDFETNPSVLASRKMDKKIQLISQNSFSKQPPFNFSTLRYSSCINNYIVGFGASLNHVTYNKVNILSTLCLAASYRNILFNAALIKIGVSYKLNSIYSDTKTFDFYNTSIINTGSTNYNSQINVGALLSRRNDDFYVSYALLNAPIKAINNGILFPIYNVIHIGNFLALTERSNNELSLSYFTKQLPNSNSITNNYNAYLKLTYPLSRKSSLNYGTRLGVVDDKYINAIPFIGWYNRKATLNLFYNYYFKTAGTNYFSSTQLNITYHL
jgi:hypothetical protein